MSMTNGAFYGLYKAGLTSSLFSMNELIGEKRQEIKAYCTSEKCCGKSLNKHILKTGVKLWAVDCPCCGHALYWTRD